MCAAGAAKSHVVPDTLMRKSDPSLQLAASHKHKYLRSDSVLSPGSASPSFPYLKNSLILQCDAVSLHHFLQPERHPERGALIPHSGAAFNLQIKHFWGSLWDFFLLIGVFFVNLFGVLLYSFRL